MGLNRVATAETSVIVNRCLLIDELPVLKLAPDERLQGRVDDKLADGAASG